MDWNEALDVVAMLVAAYPNWKPSGATQRLYAEVLQPARADLVKQAAMEIIRSDREFAPPVGVICAAAARLELTAAGAKPLLPEEAWELVAEQIRFAGYYRQPKFDSPLITRAVAALDWRDMCSNENVEATRAHFFRVFKAFQQREVEDVAVLGISPEKRQVESVKRAELPEPALTADEIAENRQRMQELLAGLVKKS